MELQTCGVEGRAGESGVLSDRVGAGRDEGGRTGAGGRGQRERVHRDCREKRGGGGVRRRRRSEEERRSHQMLRFFSLGEEEEEFHLLEQQTQLGIK